MVVSASHVDLRVTSLSGMSAPLLGEAMLDVVAHVDFQAVGGLAPRDP